MVISHRERLEYLRDKGEVALRRPSNRPPPLTLRHNYTVEELAELVKRYHYARDRVKPGIYFIRAGDEGPIKIGRTQCMGRRLSDLQTAHYEPLQVFSFIEVTEFSLWKAETTLRSHFSRHRLRGEWFRPAREIIQFCRGGKS